MPIKMLPEVRSTIFPIMLNLLVKSFTKYSYFLIHIDTLIKVSLKFTDLLFQSASQNYAL